MSSSRKAMMKTAALLLSGVCASAASAQGTADRFPGVGRNATSKEVAAWDIDVRPDFKGLPKGSGSVEKGQEVWEAKCASCHGVFGESNEVFSPLIGGTTKDDIKTGNVARLKDASFPGRTTFMKVPTISTVWDYINRAMPWNAPKSLSHDEVYAVTAYMLNLADIVPPDFTLSDKNIAEVQAKMPNRNGMTTHHAMWPGTDFVKNARPDTKAVACMKDCGPEPQVRSRLPDHASNNHGNLVDQNRPVGAQRGMKTDGKPAAVPAATAASAATAKPHAAAVPTAILEKNGCVACHGMEQKIVGPGFREIASKHAGQTDYLLGKIKNGGTGVWGNIPMPPQPGLSDDEAKSLANWLAGSGK
ncbi:c-type cytochrome [Diaphorobacter aerolatus]|uniref:C-type cytochrome n=1 Tax=Diaphorobacter aerolatus TaxID=1288495 RepID=A0A7H0GJP4_9BURK|nr:c-type cytochrome [Diaphorobacter aerolatus]QNP48510.1 c-type cytochrome [Diaphorobacter aerolatus]